MPRKYSYINTCASTCTDGISVDENGFKFITNCSTPFNRQCYFGNERNIYVQDENSIPSRGSLQECPFKYCKVIFL